MLKLYLIFAAILNISFERKNRSKTTFIFGEEIINHFIKEFSKLSLMGLYEKIEEGNPLYSTLYTKCFKNNWQSLFAEDDIDNIAQQLQNNNRFCDNHKQLKDLSSFSTKKRIKVIDMYLDATKKTITKTHSRLCKVEFCMRFEEGNYRLIHLNKMWDCLQN